MTRSHSNIQDRYVSDKNTQNNEQKLPCWKRMIYLFQKSENYLAEYEKAICKQRLSNEYEEYLRSIQNISGGRSIVRRNPMKSSSYTRIELP